MSVQTKKRMNKKLIVSIVVLALVSVASILGIVTVLALTQRNIDSSIFIRFTAIDIDGEVEAAYRVGNADTWTSMSGETPHVFNASDAESNTQMNPGDITLISANNFVEFRYTFRNFGDADYTGILTLDEVATENNMEIQYKYNDSEYSTSSYGLVVEGVDTADSSKLKTRGEEKYTEMVYYVKVSVKELSKSANYSSDFFWLLERYDGEVTGQVIPMSTSEFVSNGDGTFLAKYKGANINVANVSTDSAYKIENVWNIPNNFGSAPVTKIIRGDDLPANTKVVIGDNVTTIDGDTFSSVNPENNACTGLVEIVLGKSITTIPGTAFLGCVNLSKVDIPYGVTTIGSWAFTYCNNLKSLVIPSSVISMNDAFLDSSIENIKIEEGLTTIGMQVFQNVTSLKTIDLPNTLITIGDNAFEGCSGLKEINIPSSVTTIGNDVFKNCTALTSLIIPDTVTSMGTIWLEVFSALKTIRIPACYTESLVCYNFQFCSALETIIVSENNPNYSSDGHALYNKDKTTLYVGTKTLKAIPTTVTSIYSCAFYYTSTPTTLWVPSSVTTINDSGPPMFGGGVALYCEATSSDDVNYDFMFSSVTLNWGYTYERYMSEIIG